VAARRSRRASCRAEHRPLGRRQRLTLLLIALDTPRGLRPPVTPVGHQRAPPTLRSAMPEHPSTNTASRARANTASSQPDLARDRWSRGASVRLTALLVFWWPDPRDPRVAPPGGGPTDSRPVARRRALTPPPRTLGLEDSDQPTGSKPSPTRSSMMPSAAHDLCLDCRH
jgi:hypothetical protein